VLARDCVRNFDRIVDVNQVGYADEECEDAAEGRSATFVAPAPAAEALSDASAPRADSCTCAGDEAVDEENTDCADEKRRDASARIASLRVSNIEVRSWEAIITPKTRRMTRAATVITRAMRADRECRIRLAR